MIYASSIKIKDSTTYHSLLDIFYPIGSVYISTNNTRPADFLGGTWAPISEENAVLRAANTYGLTGSDTCTLTTNQIPAHNHSINEHNHSASTSVAENNVTTSTSGGHIHKSADAAASNKTYVPKNIHILNQSWAWKDETNTTKYHPIIITDNQGSHTHTAKHSHTASTSIGKTALTTNNSGGGLHTVSFNVLSIVLCESELDNQEGDALWH